MRIHNPYAGSDPLQVTAITADNRRYTMSLTSYPYVDIDDDVLEMLVRWQGPGYDISKAWTKEKGWLEISEYEERKAFEAEKAELERQKERNRIRTKPLAVQLDLKVTPSEDNPTTPDPE
jgi:hypothetical protein